MRIVDVQTVLLTGPCTNDPYLSEARGRRSAAFIEVQTDKGLVGVGETYAGYFFPEAVPPTVEFFKPILLGQTVEDISTLWSRMYHCGNFWCRTGLGLAILGGIEAALWDLQGQVQGKPVCELLGGPQHDWLPCYATGGPSNYPLEKLAEKVAFYLSLGFGAVKVGAGAFRDGAWQIPHEPELAAALEREKLQFLRQRFGDDVQFMLDGHMGNSPTTWSYDTAEAVVQTVEPFGLIFFEEPLHYTNLAGYRQLCQATRVPIAGGEVLTGASEWQHFVEAQAFDVAQLDAAFIGGMGQFMAVARQFADQGRPIATHSWGAGACLMQNLHSAFACSKVLTLEFPPAYGPLHHELIVENLEIIDGQVRPPTTAGLGIRLTDEVKTRYPFVPGSGEFNSVPGKVLAG